MIPADPTLPIPSNAHWMPLASIVQVPFLALFGDVAWAAALPFALIGAIAAPLTWAIARDAGARPFVAVGAGFLVAVPLLSTVYMAQPDNFSLYQPLVIARCGWPRAALRGSGRAFVAAGFFAGLATLARNDGLLVLAALGVVFAWDRWRAWRAGRAERAELARARAPDDGAPRPAARRSRCRGGRRGRRLRPRHGAVVGAPAGGLRLALAVEHVGQGPVHPGHRRMEQHHDPGLARPPARDGHRPAHRDADRRRDRGRR